MDSGTNGIILHYQRLSTEDGPGIRTTVFMKGCPLGCKWCHNPESISIHPQLHWLENRCIGCGTCLKVCPSQALIRLEAKLKIDRKACDGCGICAHECPANAIDLLGRQVTADEVIQELVKDEAFFKASAGGITLSGGEPTMQPRFTSAILAGVKRKSIGTAIDTCGLCSWQILAGLLPDVDVILYDLKFIEPVVHQKHTGQENQRILENLQRLSGALDHGKELWVRTPLIPGATCNQENIQAIGSFIRHHLTGKVTRWELCAFNNLCREKYRRLDLTWEFANEPLFCGSELEMAEKWAKDSGCDPGLVSVTGAVRIE